MNWNLLTCSLDMHALLTLTVGGSPRSNWVPVVETVKNVLHAHANTDDIQYMIQP